MLEEIKVSDLYEVLIEKQDHFGNGLVKIKNIFVFVKNALPGDMCKIEITNVKKNFANAKIKEIINPSSFRVKVKCPYYEKCGGCHIMHEEYTKQLKFKEEKVSELLKKFTGLEDINMYPIKFKEPFYYRNKVIFHGENKELGFYQEKTNKLVPIKECIITNSKLNVVYKDIQKYLYENKDERVDNLLLRITSLNEILVVLEGNIHEDRILPYLNNVSTIYLNNKLVRGNSYIEEELFGIKFKIYPSSFFQVNYEMMLVLYKTVMNFYKDKNYDKVLDLYCGTGTIGMLVSSYVKEVIGVEKESSSIVSANLCKKVNNISNISFIHGKVEDKIDLFKDIDSIIVDPPRSGLDNHTLEIIIKLSPKTITYISCDPVTLARDLKVLKDKYQVLEVHPVDMFPNTYHVENVVFLERK
jgi:23S rRNA (uracil1939-C5)-methyltransferase